MSGKRYVDGSCEIVCFGRRATVHDRRFDRYYSVGAEELAEQSMAGIKQNGILGQLLRDSWLASAEHLV